MQDFKKMYVWKKSIDLNLKIYALTKDFPKSELYGLINQIRRASVSVSSNIAEGCGRNTNKDFRNFLFNALGSLKEVECQLIISEKLNYLTKEFFDETNILINEISKMLVSFIKKLS